MSDEKQYCDGNGYCVKSMPTAQAITAERDALLQSLEDLDRIERQELGAAISWQSWHKTEGAHNRLRDKLSAILMPSRSAKIQAALKGKS